MVCVAPTRQASRSFTLIELVAIIVILGVLGVVALPRIVDFEDAAHRVTLSQNADAFRAAIQFAHLGCRLAGYASGDNLPGFGAGDVDFNANCFPSSTNGNNGPTVNANRCLQIWNGVLASAPSISTPANDTTDYRAQGSGSTCTYTYRNDTDDLRRFTYNSADGAVSIVSNP